MSTTARRVAQTPRMASNHPRVLLDLLSSRAPWRREVLEFRLRNGLTVRCPNVPGARVPVYELFAEDAYDLNALTSDLPTGFVAVDIGGQVGCFSLALSIHRPDARVHTYEASPVTADWLERNVTANGLTDRITVHPTALSDRTGSLEFRDNGAGSGLNGLTADPGSGTVITVPCITFDDAVADAGGRVDVVKLDTEGAEYSIVLGSSPAAWADVQRVVLEYHDVPGHDWDELARFFVAAGLEVTRRDAVTSRVGTAWLRRVSLPGRAAPR